MPARVLPYKVQLWFVLVSVLALPGDGQELIKAQTQGATGGSNQATLNARPSVSTPRQRLPKTHHRHGASGEENQAWSGVKSSPAKAEQSARANLSSVGPGGYSNVLQPFLGGANWAGSSFLPPAPQANVRPPWAAGHQRRNDYVLAVPVYIPYASEYDNDGAVEGNQEPGAEAAEFSDADQMNNEGMPEDASEQMAPEVAPEPVVTQPATVLVFKDGHRADVVNYAIVGDTLFDFGDGLTRKIQLTTIDLAATEKANEAIGVEFKLPPASNR